MLPGVWRRKEGGHVVRGRATDSKTGKQKDIFRALPEANEQTALKWLRDEQARIRAGTDDSPEGRHQSRPSGQASGTQLATVRLTVRAAQRPIPPLASLMW